MEMMKEFLNIKIGNRYSGEINIFHDLYFHNLTIYHNSFKINTNLTKQELGKVPSQPIPTF